MLIGIISDTHIPNRAKGIPEQVLKGFEKVDLIIHAGDICEKYVLDQLKEIAPVKAVVGNTDGVDLQKRLPRKEIINVRGFNIGIIHGDGGKRINTLQRVIDAFKNEKVDCIVFGHTHQAYHSLNGSTLLFNPGSPTDKRKSKYYSYGLIKVQDFIEAKILYFS